MFRKNDTHLQPPLLSTVRDLPEKQRHRLESSWANIFYHEFFQRVDESVFASLYSDKASRPNTPVNLLVSLEFLKAGRNWSDEEMYNQFQFNLQVRYALGLHSFDTGQFELRTVYNFRRKLAKHQKETGEELLAVIFNDVTDEQLAAYGLYTEQQRMDSSQISSNIADMSRLELVVTAVQRLAELLNEGQQAACAEWLEPYQKGNARQFVYRVKGKAATQEALQAAGNVLARLLSVITDDALDAGNKTTSQAAARLFAENFSLTEAETVYVKQNDEITSGALQSLDDLEATFRRKGGKAYKGYVVNITETCDPRNELQLITNVQVAPNNVDDATLLCEAAPQLKERTNVTDLYTDGGFGSPAADLVLREHDVQLHQTHLRGKSPDPTKYSLADFAITCDDAGNPAYLGCPHGQIVPVSPARTTGFVTQFNMAHCRKCPAYGTRCPVRLMKRHPVCQLNFTLEKVLWALRRQRHRQLRQTPDDPRAAIEATVRTVKHPYKGRLPVRGLRRVTDMMIGAAAMSNIRSILRYHKRKRKRRAERAAQRWQETYKTYQENVKQAWDNACFFSLSLSNLLRKPVSETCFSC